MGLTFPVDPVIELWMNGWADVTIKVRQTSPITITRGRSDERGAVGPSKCTLLLDNTDGAFTPDNPSSAYYGLLGRNTPLRYSLRLVRDTFTRTVSDGWGSTDTSDAWTNTGNGTPLASDFQVASGVGTQSVPATVTYRRSYLAASSFQDVEVRCTLISVGFSNVTGGAIEPANVFLRGHESPSIDYYMARVTIETDETVKIGILQASTGIFVSGLVTVSGLVYTGQALGVAIQAEKETLRAKVWDATLGEPHDWQVQATPDGSLGPVLTGGYVGIRSGVASGNTNTKPVVFSYDNFEVRSVRFAGEIATLSPRWNVPHTDKTVSVEAAGIMRRLGQGRSQPRSAIERFIRANAIQPVAYWPLDDGNRTTAGRVAVGTGIPAIINYIANVVLGVFPQLAFGTGVLASWLAPCALVTHESFVRCALVSPLSGSWTVHWLIRFDGRYTDNSGNNDGFVIGQGGGTSFTISFFSFSQEIDIAGPSGSSVATFTTSVYDDVCHHMGFRSTQNGADVDWVMFIDGAIVTSGTILSTTNQVVQRCGLTQNGNNEDHRTRVLGHVSIYSGDGPAVSEIYDAMFGYNGESSGTRIFRLCLDESIPISFIGDFELTGAMGPQGTLPVIDLLQQCSEVDRGTLFEPRGLIGLTYRTLLTLENQSALLALDYSSAQVSPPFDPAYDDQNTRNIVTASRIDGSQVTVSQTSGPLNTGNPGDDPDSVGVYEESVTVNVETDSQLQDIAGWAVHLGTVKEARFPKVHLDLAATSAIRDSSLGVDVDDRITISGLSAIDIRDNISQLARGMTEVLNTVYRLDITFNTAPESPYHVVTLDNSTLDRLDSSTTTLNETLDTTETGVDVAIGDSAIWTTTSGEWPFDVSVGGERMTVTAVSGASSPQTFTVTRSVNGVVKTHPIGATVQLADPLYVGV